MRGGQFSTIIAGHFCVVKTTVLPCFQDSIGPIRNGNSNYFTGVFSKKIQSDRYGMETGMGHHLGVDAMDSIRPIRKGNTTLVMVDFYTL